MTTKSLNIKYIEISEPLNTSDISIFIENLESMTIEDARVVYSYIKKDMPMEDPHMYYTIGKNDLYNIDDKEGITIKNYIISISKKAIEVIIYPLAGCKDIEKANIEGCFTMFYKNNLLIGTTGSKVSFGTNNFINKYHIFFFLLKRYKFPKIV